MEDQINPEAGQAESAESADNQDAHAQTDAAAQAEEQPQQTYHLPPGYAYDPASGQVFYVGPAIQQPVQPASVQPGGYAQAQQPDPEQIAAAQAASTQRYGQVVHSVEQFLEGEATVSDVVKTLYTNTTQDDQLLKGVIVGAAAAVLLTSKPVRKAMGQTFGGVFSGLKQSKQSQQTAAATTGADKEVPTELPIADK